MKKIIALALILIMLFAVALPASAASVSVSKTSITVEKGKTASFKITASDAQAWATVSVADSSVAKTNISDDVWVENSSSTVKVTGVKIGTTTITVSFPEAASADGSQNLSGKTVTVKVNVIEPKATTTAVPKETTTKVPVISKLSGLSVGAAYALTPAFSTDVYDYTVAVPQGTNTLVVAPILEELTKDGATVTVTGADDLAAANNTVTILVTSADGVQTTYTINVTYTEVEDSNGLPIWFVFFLVFLMIIVGVIAFFIGKNAGKKNNGPKAPTNYNYDDADSISMAYEPAQKIDDSFFNQSAD